MKLCRGYTYLRSETEAASVCKTGRSIPVNTGTVDAVQELLSLFRILCKDGLTVMCTVQINMLYSFLCTVNCPDGNLVIKIYSTFGIGNQGLPPYKLNLLTPKTHVQL